MNFTNAQCTNTNEYLSATASTTVNEVVTISYCADQGDYNIVNSIVAGYTYTLGADCGGYITVRSGSYNGTVVNHGNAPLTFTAPTSGTYYIHYNTNSSCGTASTCCETTVTRVSTPCFNIIANGSVAAPSGGNTTTISTCQRQNEYATITGAASGNTYILTSSCGGYITITSGSPSGTVVSSGNSPLSFTAPSNGTYYVHYNTNSSCGTATTCCTSTIEHIENPPCQNNSQFGSISAPTSGTATISSCQYRDEYSTISNVVGGSVYSVNLSCSSGGTYITVRIGSYNGTVVATGPAPLQFTAPSNGTYYIHYNAGSDCSYVSGCCTSTMTCVSCLAPPATPQDCEGAILVCSNNSFAGNSNGGGLYSELNSGNQGCMSTEHESSWYYVHVGQSGTLEMTISPDNGTDDYDWAIWGPFTAATAAANCSPVSDPIRCSWNAPPSYDTGMGNGATDTSEGASGDGWIMPLDVLGDQVYVLLIDNFSGSTNPFSLTWGGTAELSCVPVVLGVDISLFEGTDIESNNQLVWKTNREVDNDYFILEHSEDGTNWNIISKKDGFGYSTEIKSYSHLHKYVTNTMNYYRLTQVDFNGNKRTYGIVVIDNNSAKTLLRTLNLLGQEVNDNYKGLVIEYYDDNSIIKKFRK
ncbi:MAG: hypothetical protein M9916_07800 [Crocinitomicaceae bacterium]|nr:hypothetical protein [Crocinitomicaceae bacterium]